MSDKDFINKYLEDFSSLVKPNDQIIEKIINTRDILVQAKKNNAKIITQLLQSEEFAAFIANR